MAVFLGFNVSVLIFSSSVHLNTEKKCFLAKQNSVPLAEY